MTRLGRIAWGKGVVLNQHSLSHSGIPELPAPQPRLEITAESLICFFITICPMNLAYCLCDICDKSRYKASDAKPIYLSFNLFQYVQCLIQYVFALQSRLSVQYDDSPYLCSRSSMVSSPRFSTSFHAKEIVYPSCKVSSQNRSHHTRPASEIKYRSSEAALHRKQSAWSLAASGDQSCYKTFQDPVQKTYSGDLLLKHSQHFTQDKPFTPKTLKSDKTSYLSKYRYYRAPQRKPTLDCTNSRLMRQETYHGRY